MRKVLIINPNAEYERLFEENGWELTTSLSKADLVQFTGGSDVDPPFYLRQPHPLTQSNPVRDRNERQVFIDTVAAGKPMAGICRGGQFLNVMCGGRMWQHVHDHAIRGTHPMTLLNGRIWHVTSTHHQMMIPSKEGQVIGVSEVCTHKETISKTGEPVSKTGVDPDDPDIEVVFYPRHLVLCFQPHPEYVGYEELGKDYIELIEDYLF